MYIMFRDYFLHFIQYLLFVNTVEELGNVLHLRVLLYRHLYSTFDRRKSIDESNSLPILNPMAII